MKVRKHRAQVWSNSSSQYRGLPSGVGTVHVYPSTNKHTNKQTNKQTNKETNKQTNKLTEKILNLSPVQLTVSNPRQSSVDSISLFVSDLSQAVSMLDSTVECAVVWVQCMYLSTNKQTNKQANKQASKQTKKQTNKETNKQTNKQKQTKAKTKTKTKTKQTNN